MERAIGFLLESQARHDAQIGELRDQVSGLTGQVAETNRIVQMHAESQIEFIGTVTRALEGLAAAQSQTDARLDRLAATVERLAEGRG